MAKKLPELSSSLLVDNDEIKPASGALQRGQVAKPATASPAEKEKTENLQISLPESLVYDFRVTATTNKLKLNQLFVACYEAWKQQNNKTA